MPGTDARALWAGGPPTGAGRDGEEEPLKIHLYGIAPCLGGRRKETRAMPATRLTATEMDQANALGPLVGGVLENVSFTVDYCPVLYIRSKHDGGLRAVIVWRDEEGNGPGFVTVKAL